MQLVRGIVEGAGWAAGWALAPAVALGTRLRGSRLLHPDGRAYSAVATVEGHDRVVRALASRLGGAALARLSAAVWRGREWPDVLGLAVRFYGRPPGEGFAESGVQDVLLASAPGVLTLPLGFLLTDPHDFLANEYRSLAPFEVPGLGAVHLRAVSPNRSPAGADRHARLAAAIEHGLARFSLELRRERESQWVSLLVLELEGPADMDQRELRFSPFNDQAGLRPSGFVQWLRAGAYGAAHAARGARSAANGRSTESRLRPARRTPASPGRG